MVLNLRKGRPVKATRLGKFKVVKVKARQSYSVFHGKVVKMKGYTKIKFTATKSLKDSLNK